MGAVVGGHELRDTATVEDGHGRGRLGTATCSLVSTGPKTRGQMLTVDNPSVVAANALSVTARSLAGPWSSG